MVLSTTQFVGTSKAVKHHDTSVAAIAFLTQCIFAGCPLSQQLVASIYGHVLFSILIFLLRNHPKITYWINCVEPNWSDVLGALNDHFMNNLLNGPDTFTFIVSTSTSKELFLAEPRNYLPSAFALVALDRKYNQFVFVWVSLSVENASWTIYRSQSSTDLYQTRH